MRVLCILENASDEISGVKFEQVEGGMLSEEISDDVAALFLEIPHGYRVYEAPAAGAAVNKDEKQALLAEASALGLVISPRTAVDKIRAQIDEAKAAAAGAAEGTEKKEGE